MKKNTKLKPGEFLTKKAANQERQRLYDGVKFAVDCRKEGLNHTLLIDGHIVVTSIHDYWNDADVKKNYAIIRTKNGVGLASIDNHESKIMATFVDSEVTFAIGLKDIKIWCASVFVGPMENGNYVFDRAE